MISLRCRLLLFFSKTFYTVKFDIAIMHYVFYSPCWEEVTLVGPQMWRDLARREVAVLNSTTPRTILNIQNIPRHIVNEYNSGIRSDLSNPSEKGWQQSGCQKEWRFKSYLYFTLSTKTKNIQLIQLKITLKMIYCARSVMIGNDCTLWVTVLHVPSK